MAELQIMYPPQKDSPTTFLLGDISTTDTQITVAGAAILPVTLPFPLTIGIDKNITETVMVTAVNRNNNQLTVTRATGALAWPAGSKCARVLNASDISSIQDNIGVINTNLEQTASSLINVEQDVTVLQTTVGDSSSGLVKGISDEVTRATADEEEEILRATTAER